MKAIAVVGVLLLSGCAYFSPQRHVAALDPKLPKYNTPDCQAARDAAMRYDDRMAERVAAGAGVGRLGPVGLLAAVKIDADQHAKRTAAKEAVDKACL